MLTIQISSLLADKAVTLRIPSDSQEAGYLAAYFPVSDYPTVIIIINGQLVAHLRAGVEFWEFKDAVLQALTQLGARGAGKGSHEPNHRDGVSVGGPSSHNAQPQNSVGPSVPNVAATGTSDTSNSSPVTSVTAQSQTPPTPAPSNLQQVMEARRRRLEAGKAAKDAAVKEEKKLAAQARHEAASASPETPVSKQSLYAQEQRKRKQEVKEERERILKAIENDRAERKRKDKEARRRAPTEAEAVAEVAKATDVNKINEIHEPGPSTKWSATPQLRQCSLVVRLFDGTTIREKFEPEQTLGDAVRAWIAEQRTDGDVPFTLKQVLTPLPNRNITMSEENESLQSLDLLPSATFVMVPIQGYIDAYANDQGLLNKAVSVGYSTALAGGSLIMGALGTVLGFGQATPNSREARTKEQRRNDSSPGGRHPVASAERANIRTPRPQDKRSSEHQLYNGNQVRKDTLPSDVVVD
ncbi:MAG: hypothetical protein LQ348_007085 [Seirophora lacunosa]|nr:MAG: hypothetical protein LQ348_007085 [Seirophora lacunosa]